MARIVPNSGGIKELLNSSEIEALLMDHMQGALASAQANAPVLTGAYRASLTLEAVDDGGTKAVTLSATVPYAIYVEADTGNLSRSLDAAR